MLLGFFKTWCPNCRRESPTKEKLFQEFKDRGLIVLAVSFNEPADLVKKFQNELELSCPVLVDADGKVAAKYQLRGHPVSFLIDRRGF